VKVAIYARYSSDNQRDASIADQLRVCREFATRQGWTGVQEFTDHAISGATLLRSGLQALMRDALNQRFDIVLAEALDRFSRDQEDTAGLFKRLTFAGVNIVTLAEGDITHAPARRVEGHDERALPEGPCRQDTTRVARSSGTRKVRGRSLLRLQGETRTA
jgi:DNA invertase Pin-like site-specific DNA recombinase